MKQWLMILPCVAALLCGCTEKPAQEMVEDVEPRISDYYRKPNPDWALSALPRLDEMVQDEKAASPIYGFVVGVVKTSADRKEEWKAASKKCARVKPAVDAGLECETLGDVVTAGYEDYSPELLDMIWGYFMATGDAEAPRRVIHRGGMKVPCNASFDLTAKAAAWSSCSLAKEHPIVRTELESFAMTAEPEAILNFFGEAPLQEAISNVLSSAALDRIQSVQEDEKRRGNIQD